MPPDWSVNCSAVTVLACAAAVPVRCSTLRWMIQRGDRRVLTRLLFGRCSTLRTLSQVPRDLPKRWVEKNTRNPRRRIPKPFLNGDHASALAKPYVRHVHEPGAATQVGARREAPVILTVDAAAMHAAGHAFYQAANGVWLTDHVPPGYLSGWPARAGSRRTRPFHARGSAAHPGSAGWHAPPPRRPPSRTPVRSPRHGSSGPPPPSPGP